MTNKWQFWVDRGGTFTDIVALSPQGAVSTHKYLSENPQKYPDAAIYGIRQILGLAETQKIPAKLVSQIRMGTTVATNALLEKKGEKTLLITTRGFADGLAIAYQNRPDIFARQIIKPDQLYSAVLEVDERLNADGSVHKPIETQHIENQLHEYKNQGFMAVAVVFLHGYKNPVHELIMGEICQRVGFTQISLSHQVSPMVKFVGRGDTTVVDAYLSPILRRYVAQVAGEIEAEVSLQFMQSNGGLTSAHLFQGKDAILSGPAGGIVGAARAGESAGYSNIIGFDIGGTSTDISYYNGAFLRTFDSVVAGVRVRAPMLQIHTLAAGGGSVCYYDGLRLRVGPHSAGANPGPACYGRGGPLTITDCNVYLGRIQPQFLGKIFGKNGDEYLNRTIIDQQLTPIAQTLGITNEELAEGFLAIAVDNMANGIKKISVQQGHDLTHSALVAFGGAGGQLACQSADAVGIDTIIIHPYSGVLSAFGIGMARLNAMRTTSFGLPLNDNNLHKSHEILNQLQGQTGHELAGQGVKHIEHQWVLYVRYNGSDVSLPVVYGNLNAVASGFEKIYQSRFGFTMPGKEMIIESLVVESSGGANSHQPGQYKTGNNPQKPISIQVYNDGKWGATDMVQRESLAVGQVILGPAIIAEAIGTNVILPGWQATPDTAGNLILTRAIPRPSNFALGTAVDPIKLEIFNNLFMAIAEQMGFSLQNTAFSVNIKERLDFSCAIFDKMGHLVANAPHMPVHLGSMGESIVAVQRITQGQYDDGDVYLVNTPYNGGTHLPDVTAVTPIFINGRHEFFVASRGHHADIGGKTPGSMPPDSVHIDEEGIQFDGFKVVDKGIFLEEKLRAHLLASQYPARNPAQNIADIQAQIAANAKGRAELQRICDYYGLNGVLAYMGYVQDNAEACVRRVIAKLQSGQFAYKLDNGAEICVKITTQHDSAIVDFTGTSPQLHNNFNAPSSVARAAVLYVFRSLVDDIIPMNEGCLKPIQIIIPKNSMISPTHPAAVVAGNVETSQVITDAIYGALGVMAGAQGTMNNLTFGNNQYQYYETISGGSGAGDGFNGCDGVQTHMTNSRLTDPEILELRFPVRLHEFSYRRGSGGAGKYRGGDGLVRKIEFLQEMTAVILANRRIIPPFGLHGGGNGQLGETYVIRTNGTRDIMGFSDKRQLQAGDIICIHTPGGGGFGI